MPLEKQIDVLSADLDFALELSDHQVYTEKVLSDIKDWMKIDKFDFGREIYYLQQAIDLDPGVEKLVSYIKNKLGLKKRNK